MAQVDDIKVKRSKHTVDPAVAEAARLEVARRAIDVTDAAKLLAMLGLDGARMRKSKRNNRDWPSNPIAAPPPAPLSEAARALAVFLRRPDWYHRAACAGDDPELWHPVSETDSADSADDAVQTCLGCPVREQCGAFAVHNDLQYGVWAGYRLYVKAEREALRKLHEEPTEGAA
ncbi:WhiB family transcriptional regulator [Nocardia gipuzkoensis]